MAIKQLILFLFSFCFVFTIQAQNSKALAYYNNLRYAKASKLLQSKHTSIEDELLLANTYLKLNEPKKAEINLMRAIGTYPNATQNFDQLLTKYIEVLMQNTKYAEARGIYAANKDKLVKNADANDLYKAIVDKEKWQQVPKKYQMYALPSINSQFNDFGLCYYNNNYYYVTSKDKDYIGYGGIDAWMQQPYTTIHKAEIKNKTTFKDLGLVLPKVENAYNQGPVAFNKAGDVAYYSMAVTSSGSGKKIFHNQIFQSNLVNGKWQLPVSMPFNLMDYNFMHPFISADGTQLYFSSNITGGLGGYDLYVTIKKGDTWSEPKNLGKAINTKKDEVFPHLNNKTLYFASSGHTTIGGLDVFYINRVAEGWQNEAINMREPINSPADDFAFFLMDSIGYFSSNRTEGKGGDDVYGFTVDQNLVDAQYLLANDRSINKYVKTGSTVELYDADQLVASAVTDDKGILTFYNIDKNKSYNLLVKQNKTDIADDTKMYLANELRAPVKLAKRKGDDFLFSNVPANVNGLKILGDEMYDGDMAITAIAVAGNDFTKPIKNLSLSLLDNDNVIYQSRITDNSGQFTFNRLNTQNTLFCKIDEALLKYLNLDEISIYSLDKVLLATIKVNAFGRFEFQLLPADKKMLALMVEEDVPYAIDFSGVLKKGTGNKEVLKGVDVLLLNEKGEILQRSKSSSNGQFKFTRLAPDQNYMMMTDAEDPVWKNVDVLTISDDNGKIIYTQSVKKANAFNFPVLTNDQSRLSLMAEDEVAYEYAIAGKLLGDGKTLIKNAEVRLKENNGATIFKSQFTNDKGQFNFRNLPMNKQLNLDLNKEDKVFTDFNELVITDMKGKEIYRAKKASFGFSFLTNDTKLLSMIEANDEAVFQPKTFSFQLLSSDGKPLSNRNVQLMNGKRKIVYDGNTDANGYIYLKEINVNEDYNLVMLTGKEKFVSALALADSKGNVVKRGYMSKDGSYRFTILKQDIVEMSQLPTEDATFKLLNKNVNWNNIYFDYGKFAITQNSATELDKLIAYMKLDAKIKAEIDAHTDVVSDAQYNLILSKKRLAAVLDYITNKGIDKKRLIGKYFGESKPLQKKASDAEYTEADNNLNRRAEFKLFVK
jgi:outer membrane protein OmpA-like peptidoglycan-associated protein